MKEIINIDNIVGVVSKFMILVAVVMVEQETSSSEVNIIVIML